MKKALENEFHIVLEGESHEVDAVTLAETIENMNTLIHELNQELRPEYPIELKVKTFDEGSFDILFALIADPSVQSTIFTILNKDHLEIASNIISTLSDLFSIKQFLKGEKPQSIENTGDNQTKIENSTGDIKIVNAKSGDIILNNPTINITINNTFNTLKNKPEIEGLSFLANKENENVKISNAEFLEMASGLQEINQILQSEESKPNRTITKKEMPLSIFKIVFDDKYKWQFVNNDGQKISATIKDKIFFEKVKTRELYFTNGDVIIADVEIFQIYNEMAKAYENKNYTIIDINDIRHQPNQAKLEI
ncbi:MAG: hypothetical protein H7239_09730 [Flavobacterium sp.]|nr:hypothetical protein [Flavobacterium sp.]